MWEGDPETALEEASLKTTGTTNSANPPLKAVVSNLVDTMTMEDNFSMDLGGGWVGGWFEDDSSALHLLCTLFLLLFLHQLRLSDIRFQRLGTPALKDADRPSRACLPELRRAGLQGPFLAHPPGHPFRGRQTSNDKAGDCSLLVLGAAWVCTQAHHL